MSFIPARPRATHDFYGPVHKGLRFALAQLLIKLGACDAGDAAAVSVLMMELRLQLDLSAHHLDNEDLHVHAALESRAPGATARLIQSHDHHRLAFEELEVLIGQVERAPAADRAQALKRLYLRFSEFVGEDFAHMAEEEQVILPVLQSLFTDEELAAIEDQIVSALKPEDMIAFGRLLIPASTRAERLAMLQALRANAPAEAFAAILDLAARPSLCDADWRHLAEGLELAA